MNKFKSIYLILSGMIILFACEKEGEKITIRSTVTPMVLNSITGPVVLTMENATGTFPAFIWTSADYGFKAAVKYQVQMDVKGNNFAAPVEVASVTNKDTAIITMGDFNKILLNKELEPGTETQLQFRVKATVNDSIAPVYSNVVEAAVTPYATVFPPIYMIGAATGGWDVAKRVEMRSSAPSVYETVAYFLSNQTFRFFKQPDWGPTSYNYPFFEGGTISNLLQNANDGDKNFQFLGTTGYYKITADLKNKSVQMEVVAEPVMFMTGAALGGWDWDTNYVKMTWISNGIFEAVTDFQNGETFRFFAQKDWGPTSYNYPYFAEGTVDPLFENANDGDKNFRFTGTTGTYKITLNMLDKTVVMAKQ